VNGAPFAERRTPADSTGCLRGCAHPASRLSALAALRGELWELAWPVGAVVVRRPRRGGPSRHGTRASGLWAAIRSAAEMMRSAIL
jgi:hypothetical protein